MTIRQTQHWTDAENRGNTISGTIPVDWNAPAHCDLPSSRRQRTLQPRSASTDGSVRARLFGFEARREAREERRETREARQEAREERREAREGRQGEELAAIRATIQQLCGMMAQYITDMQARNELIPYGLKHVKNLLFLACMSVMSVHNYFLFFLSFLNV